MRISRDLSWLWKVFQRQPDFAGDTAFEQPGRFDPNLKLIVDAYGSTALDNSEFQLITDEGTVGPTTSGVENSIIAADDGFVRFVLAAHAYHNDGAVSHTLQLFLRQVTNPSLPIAVTEALLVAENFAVATQRTLWLPSGWIFEVHATPIVPLGDALSIRTQSLYLPRGEFLHAP